MAESGLAAQAYEKVRKAILKGDIAPGDALVENRLADKLGMSRTPVRQALQVLARDGFIESVANRGYVVPKRSIEDVRELFELRESLEGMASRCAALRATDADIDELGALCDRYERAREWTDWARIGTEFHSRIHVLSGNSRLVSFLDSLKAQIVLARQAELREVHGRREQAVREHRAIFEAIRARDADAAEHHARAHVRASYDLTLRGPHAAR